MKHRVPKGIPAVRRAFAEMVMAALRRLDSMTPAEREEALRQNVAVKRLAPPVPEWARGLLRAGAEALTKERERRINGGPGGALKRETEAGRLGWEKKAARITASSDELTRKELATLIERELSGRVAWTTIYKSKALTRR